MFREGKQPAWGRTALWGSAQVKNLTVVGEKGQSLRLVEAQGWQGSGQECRYHNPRAGTPPGQEPRGFSLQTRPVGHTPLPSSPQVCTEDPPGTQRPESLWVPESLGTLRPRVQPAGCWGPVLPGTAMGPLNLSAPLTGPQFPHDKMKGPSSRSHTLTPIGRPGECVGDKKPRSRTRFSTLAA